MAVIKKQAPIPEILKLKKSALVMIRMNDPEMRFINGSLGTIERTEPESLEVRLKNGKKVALGKETFSYLDADGRVRAPAVNFPVTLAYATTIHKSQRTTRDGLVCDLTRLWEPGHAYVAVNRLRRGEGLKLLAWDKRSILASREVIDFHESLMNARIPS